MSDPAHVRLKSLVSENRKTVNPAEICSNEVFHYSIPSLDERGDGVLESPRDIGSNKLLLRGGEVLISKLNPRISRVFVASSHAIPTLASTEFIALRPGREIEPRFLCYWLQAEPTRQLLDAATLSVTRSHQRVRPETLLDASMDVPKLTFQRYIADYLDRETARIDALIAAKRRMIGVLKERWQTVMHDAVAGCLVKSKRGRRRTHLPWLEYLPAHWREAQLKLIARLGTGHTPSRSRPEWWVDPTIPWVTTGEVAQMRSDEIEYITETREQISELGLANSSAELHPAETVVLCRTASAGYSAIMGRDMATSQDFATWTCGPLIAPRFLLLCLRAMRQDLLGRLAMGSTHKTIYMPDIESIMVPLPPVDEQMEIVVAAYHEQGALDTCADRLSDQIDLLAERRQALITAAVTGQLDIPEAA